MGVVRGSIPRESIFFVSFCMFVVACAAFSVVNIFLDGEKPDVYFTFWAWRMRLLATLTTMGRGLKSIWLMHGAVME
jgi:hypothetical protein